MKKILVTGARSGIINKVIDRLLKKDYYIYLTVENEKQLECVQKKYEHQSNIECLKLDVTDQTDREQVQRLDIDILINNAAIGEGGSMAEIKMDKVRKNFEENVFGPFELTQLVLKKMIQKKEGKIINMSSLAGIVPISFLGSYCATKASITTLSIVLKNELKWLDTNIKIKLIEPGLYHTGFNQVMLENKYDWMHIDSYFKSQIETIRKKESLMMQLLEKKELNSIVNKIEKAVISDDNQFIYSAPLLQHIGAKIYAFIRK